jgi:NTP pyrophosphatase (non-canonical NTP hydrolase)
MVRKVAETKAERRRAREAINELAEAFKEEYGEALWKVRSYIGDEFGDSGFYFDMMEEQARRDVEHTEVKISRVIELAREHGFSFGDAAYTVRYVRDHQKDFAHDPDTLQQLRVSLYYEYPEAEQ